MDSDKTREINNEVVPSLILIDDDEFLLEQVSLIIENALGVPTKSFADASNALEFIKAPKPDNDVYDAILCDLAMPGLGGDHFLLELTSAGFQVPVVFLSGIVNIDTMGQALRLGAFDMLKKPVDRPSLLHTVELALSVGRRRRESRELIAKMRDLLESQHLSLDDAQKALNFLNHIEESRRTESRLKLRNHALHA